MAVLGYLEEVAPADSEQVVDDGDDGDDGDGAGCDGDPEQSVDDGDGAGSNGDPEVV